MYINIDIHIYIYIYLNIYITYIIYLYTSNYHPEALVALPHHRLYFSITDLPIHSFPPNPPVLNVHGSLLAVLVRLFLMRGDG